MSELSEARMMKLVDELAAAAERVGLQVRRERILNIHLDGVARERTIVAFGVAQPDREVIHEFERAGNRGARARRHRGRDASGAPLRSRPAHRSHSAHDRPL